MGYFQAMRRQPAEFDEWDLLDPGPQLQLPPFETITGYRDGVSALSGAQAARVKAVADFIVHSWRGTAAITAIRIAGYRNTREADKPDLGQKRASAVVGALLAAFGETNETLAARLAWTVEDRGPGIGESAKVEIYLWAGPTPPPWPPPDDKASRPQPQPPAETLDQKINRILQTKVPQLPPGRSFNEMFWKRFRERVNDVMERMRVPRALRGAIRKGVEGAVRSGSDAILDQVLKAAEIPESTRKAIKGTVRALLDQKVR